MVLRIDQNTNLQDFQRSLNDADDDAEIVLNYSLRTSCGYRLASIFTGETPVTDRVSGLINEKIKARIEETFNITYELLEFRAAKGVADQLLKDCEMSCSDLKSVRSVKRIFAEIDNGVIESVGSPDPAIDLTLRNEGTAEAQAENAVKLLLGARFDSGLINFDLIKGILFVKNPDLMKGFTQALQKVTLDIFNRLSSPDVSQNQKEILDILLGSINAYYPFSEPEDGTELMIPQKIEGTWVAVTYIAETLNLTPDWLASPVPALGLTPKEGSPEGTAPLLIFRGTPQPSASGSLPATLSDMVPGYSVGEYIYEHGGKDIIQGWINRSHAKFGGVKLFGTSLGGSLSLLSMAHQPEKVREVQIYGSTSLTREATNVYTRNRPVENLPEVHIYWNNGDMVPLIGVGFHPDWHLHKIIVPTLQDPGSAHAFLNAARPKIIVMKMDPEVDSRSASRRVFNVFYQILCILVVPLAITLLALSALSIYVCNKFKRRRNLQPLLVRDELV